MADRNLNILYLVHDLSDSTVHKRALMLKDGKADMTIMGFYRGSNPPTSIHGFPAIALARTHDGKFIHRILTALWMVATIGKYRAEFAKADIVMARTLEMLAVAVRGRSLIKPAPALVYESLDIHRLLLKQNIVGKILRGLEGWLSKRASLLITSSPAFIREYFKKLSSVACEPFLIENKVYQTHEEPRPHTQHPATTPWKIGWFGAIRCRKSLDILTNLVKQMDGKVEVIIRGKPAYDQFDDFHQQISGINGLRFEGPYKNPEDLEKIYSEVHFTWAIDMFEEGLNSSWLLPNRIYEGGLYASVPLAQEHVETGVHLKRLNTGYLLQNPLLPALTDFFKSLTDQQYQSLYQNALNVPLNAFVMTQEDSLHLIQKLSSLKKDNLHE